MSPAISICIPARNEEKWIGQCLAAIREAEHHLGRPVEVIVALNRCTDRTEEIARSFGAVFVREDAKNLSIIRNAAVKMARSPYVATIDADSRMSVNMLTEVYRRLEDPKSVGGGVRIWPERVSLGIILTILVLLLWLLPKRMAGGLFWFRKEDFDAIGGFDESLVSIEDVDFAVRLRRHGRKTGRRFSMITRAYIITSCRKFDQFGDWYFLNPVRFWKIITGRNHVEANKHWYDVKRGS